MFSRLKNFADSLEESARTAAQRNLASPPPAPLQRTPSASRREGLHDRSSSRSRNPISAIKEQERDPADFESDFSSEGFLTPRAGTPVPSGAPANGGSGSAEEKKDGESTEGANGGPEKKDVTGGTAVTGNSSTLSVSELPSDVRLKLRKLEKIEAKYSELLRSYRITHARTQLIEPFEKVLRETTPCTSISEPAALTEYLNNLSLRSDMTMEEFKRVSKELSDLKKELAKKKKESDDRTKEINALKAKVKELEGNAEAGAPANGKATGPDGLKPSIDLEKIKSPVESSIAKMKSPDSTEFFSFEDEQERLDQVVKDQETEISTLKTSLESAKQVAKVAEEAAQVFQKNVEDSQRELEGMRETMVEKDNEIRRLIDSQGKLEKDIEGLKKEFEETKSAAESKTPDVKAENVDPALLAEAQKQVDLLTGEQDKLKLQIKTSEEDLEKTRAEFQERQKTAQEEFDEQLKASRTELEEIKTQKAKEIEDLTGKIEELEGETIMLKSVSDELTNVRESRSKVQKTLNETVAQKEELETKLEKVKKEKTLLESKIFVLEDRLLEASKKPKEVTSPKQTTDDTAKSTSTSQDTLTVPEKGLTASQKRNRSRRNKKKRDNTALTDDTFKPEAEDDAAISESGITEAGSESAVAEISTSTPDEPETSAAELIISNLRTEIATLRSELEESESSISKLRAKVSRMADLEEELETLRESLIDIGQESVEAKDRVQEVLAQKKELEASKDTAEKALEALQKEMEAVTADSKKIQDSHKSVQDELTTIRDEANGLKDKLTSLTGEFDLHKSSNDKTSGEALEKLETLKKHFDAAKAEVESTKAELTIAQQLSATRYKDLAERKTFIERLQGELAAQRSEVTKVNAANTEMTQKLSVLRRLEKSESDLKFEVDNLKRRLMERESDLDTVREKARAEVKTESARRIKAEEMIKTLQKELRVAEEDRKEAQDLVERLSRDLTKAQDELTNLRPKVVALERESQKLRLERDGFQEEIDLKTAQHSSAQSLMSSLRDQTSELAMQMKELKDKNESLEEELAEAQKLLSERSREAETMRRLLRDVETKQDSRIREMKERMDQAIDERDKAEEEAATISRRRTRDLEDLKDKLQEAEKHLKKIQEEKADIEKERNGLKTGKDRAEQALTEATREYDDTKKAMLNLRDALDETEKQMRDFDKQKAELRKQAEEIQQKYEKLQKSYRIATDELRMIQNTKTRNEELSRPVSRQSLDKPMSPTRRSSLSPSIESSSNSDSINVSYIKNIVLQSLEVKNKKMQIQMLPVLKMLLNFDEKDEQRWMTIVNSIK